MSFFLLPEGAIVVTRGVSELVDVTVSNEEGPQDLTGVTLYFTVKINGSDEYPLIQKVSDNITQIEIPNPTDGTAKIYLRPEDTAGLSPRRYVYDIWVVLPDGNRHSIVPTNVFEVQGGVTRLL